jgi:phosphohistidine phosphatase
MTRLLYLLRHAKSDWDDPELPDQERPLAPRGVRASKDLVKRLKKAGVAPSLVLCSPALRARQTLDLIAPALGRKVEIRYEDGLYGASAVDIVKRLGAVPASVPAVMVIGHNPTIQELTVELAGPGEDTTHVRQKFPTAAVAILEIGERGWKNLHPGSAHLVGFLTPSEHGRGI